MRSEVCYEVAGEDAAADRRVHRAEAGDSALPERKACSSGGFAGEDDVRPDMLHQLRVVRAGLPIWSLYHA